MEDRTTHGAPRWTFGPNHPDYGFGPEDWRPSANITYRPVSGRHSLRYRLDGRWSRAYEACRACGKSDRKHAGRGYCFGCYFEHRDDAAGEAGRG